MSKPRQYKKAAERKRDPRAWEVEPVEYWFEMDESQPRLMPEQTPQFFNTAPESSQKEQS